MSIIKENIQSLSGKEREELLSLLWDIIEEKDYKDPLSPDAASETSILEERLAEYKKDPATATDWEIFYKQESERLRNAKRGDQQ